VDFTSIRVFSLILAARGVVSLPDFTALYTEILCSVCSFSLDSLLLSHSSSLLGKTHWIQNGPVVRKAKLDQGVRIAISLCMRSGPRCCRRQGPLRCLCCSTDSLMITPHTQIVYFNLNGGRAQMARLALHMGGELIRAQLTTSLSFSISWMHAPPPETFSTQVPAPPLLILFVAFPSCAGIPFEDVRFEFKDFKEHVQKAPMAAVRRAF
jgi:hypothetical protein